MQRYSPRLLASYPLKPFHLPMAPRSISQNFQTSSSGSWMLSAGLLPSVTCLYLGGSSGSKEGAVEISSGDDLGIRQPHSPKDGDGLPPHCNGATLFCGFRLRL